MGKGRGKWEIIWDILKVVSEEKKAKKTRILHRAYLDWVNFQRYTNFLLEEELIKFDASDKSYELSNKGRELLCKLKDINGIFLKL